MAATPVIAVTGDKQLLPLVQPGVGNHLHPNGHGGYIVRQSDLSAWSRCQMQKLYYDQAAADPTAVQPRELSATVFGTVVHYALLLMEQAMHEGNDKALDIGLQTFEFYWQPENIERLPGGARITEWLPRDTYGGLRERGRRTLKDHYDLLRKDESSLLALEYRFAVPMEVAGRLHTLTGTVDRLSIRKVTRKPYVSLDDNKGLAIDTPIVTPEGWTVMGDLQVGDEVMGSDGHPVTVTVKSEIHDRPCYRIEFDDGSDIVCDNVHLWNVVSGVAARTATETVGMEDLATRFDAGETFRVLNAAPLRLPERELPVDPYLLGLWLGDGSTKSGELTIGDAEIWDELKARGFEVGANTNGRASNCETRTVLGLMTGLREIGVLGDKHVPTKYLRATWWQRLDLLRGLMDSDGSWAKGRRQAIFVNTRSDLAHAVAELASSMGWKVRTSHVSGYSWRVCFTPVDHNPFLVPRKAHAVDTLHEGRSARARRRKITAIETVPTVPTQCIAVDSPDRLYLAGKQMVPTHNTGKTPTYLRWNMQGTAYAYASTIPEFWTTWPESGVGELEGFDAGTIGSLDALFSSWGFRLHSGSHGEGALASRRFRWIDLKNNKFVDGGWRNARDYARLHLAVDAYVRACEAEVYAINTTGEVCRYCPFRTTCGGIELPNEEAGAP